MKDLKLRFAALEDSKQIVEWLAATPNNDLDPAILKYPTLRILCAYDGEPEAYLPTQLVVMLESLALKPGIDAHEYLEAIRTLTKGVTLTANHVGAREIYFIASDERVRKVALEHGFEEIRQPMLRMRL